MEGFQDLELPRWSRAIGSPISQEAEIWHNYLSLEQTRLGAGKILGQFKLENQKDLSPDIEFDLH